jgi:hypothetical protein
MWLLLAVILFVFPTGKCSAIKCNERNRVLPVQFRRCLLYFRLWTLSFFFFSPFFCKNHPKVYSNISTAPYRWESLKSAQILLKINSDNSLLREYR